MEEEWWDVAVLLLQLWMSGVFCLIMLPAMFGCSLGVTGVYIKILVKILKVGYSMYSISHTLMHCAC